MEFIKLTVLRLALGIVAAAGLAAPVAAQTPLKVLDWNTHHGIGTDGQYDLQRFVTWIVKSGANVVSLNEVEKFSSAGNEDQPARYAALLKAATGRTWYYSFAQRDGAAKGQGNLLLTTFPIEVDDAMTLSASRSVARIQVAVNGVRVNVFSTHLDADSSARRAAQMNEMKAWASSFAQPQIFAGDFNAWPGAVEIAEMSAVAYDAWAVAASRGIATAYPGNEAGNTRNSRIDYIWYSKTATQLTLKAAQVFDTRNAAGVMPSDHRPVMATFQVGSAPISGGGTTSVTAAKSDFTGDGRADLLWQTSDGQIAAWEMKGTSLNSAITLDPGRVSDPAWQIVGTGDLDGDGTPEIVWQHLTAGWLSAWFMNGTRLREAVLLTPNRIGSNDWRVVSVADLNADRRADLIWQHQAGWLSVWYMNGTKIVQDQYLSPNRVGAGWRVVGAGDMNGDGDPDLVFRHVDGWVSAWFMKGATLVSDGYLEPRRVEGGDWTIAAVVDLNGDGRTDLVWQHTAGWLSAWLMNGVKASSVVYLNPMQVGGTWQIVGPH